MSSETIYENPFRFYVYAYIRLKDSKTAKKGTLCDCCRKITKTAYKMEWEYI